MSRLVLGDERGRRELHIVQRLLLHRHEDETWRKMANDDYMEMGKGGST